MEAIIQCENLVKIYKVGDVEILALQGLDLTVQRGELMGIVGVSGSGKSTLMNVLGGLVRPSAGQVIVDGHNLLKLSNRALDRYRRTQVGFVWQQGARNLIPYLSAVENIELPLTLAGVKGREARRRSDKLLEMVNLADRRHHRLAALSGGEQQRVAIAVALANEPAIVLADEPTGELDSATSVTIFEAFQTLNQELGTTMLVVSHDPGIARHMGRVMAIRDGKAASETVRARRKQQDEAVAPEEEQFEELVVLDSAGRLQVPKNYREALDIGQRVRMEMVDDGLLIKAVAADELADNGPALAEDRAEPEPKPKGWRRWLGRSKRS